MAPANSMRFSSKIPKRRTKIEVLPVVRFLNGKNLRSIQFMMNLVQKFQVFLFDKN